MGKRGPKPKKSIEIVWSAEFAYAIGLLVTDGSLSTNGRHIDFTSKDIQQIKNFMHALKITHLKIGKKINSKNKEKNCFRVQIGDVHFYAWLVSIGITSRKSKTIGAVEIPPQYFFDFLRGVFDGDGSFYSYYDLRWKSSFMFYISFTSASIEFVDWLRNEIEVRLAIRGHLTHQKWSTCHQLKYAKADSLKIIERMYYDSSVLCLGRKRDKISLALKEGA